MRILLALLMMTGLARAQGEAVGDFDYYVLALSWSPNWCAATGDARGSPQCDTGAGFGWILHGLWPQYETGWPSFCDSARADPPRRQTAAMADIMGTKGLAWQQWKKHGRCSGLSATDYFDASRRAYGAVNRPPVLRRLRSPVKLAASVIQDAFLAENPALGPDMITITCKQGRIQEARICLTKDLEPRDCGADVVRDCSLSDAVLEIVR